MPNKLSETDRLKYGREITRDSNAMDFWGQLKGPSQTAVVQTELTSDKNPDGSATRIYFADDVEGDGVEGNTDFADNRGNQVDLFQDVSFGVFGNSLKSEVMTLENKKATESFRMKSKTGLTKWAALKEDKIFSSKASQNCTNIVACKNGGIYGTNSTGSIVAGDIFSTKSIKEAKRRAVNGLDGDGKLHPTIMPYYTMRKNELGISIPVYYYIMTIGPAASEQLDYDPLWLEYQKSAMAKQVAQLDIISGYKGVYEGVIIVERNRWSKKLSGIITSETADFGDYAGNFGIYAGQSDLETEVNLFLGASALLMPMDEGFDYKEIFDTENDKMVCRIRRGVGIEKTKFIGSTKEQMESIYHGKDYGVIAVVNALK
jgi:hypothetical protein